MKSNWRAAVIILTVLIMLVGAAGWYLAIVRASELATARDTLQADEARTAALGHDKDILQQQVNGLQAQVATARQSAGQAQAALATAKGSVDDMATLRTLLAAANTRADAADTQLRALRQVPPKPEQGKAANTLAATPTFDLPAAASAHAYLTAARQAIAAGNTTRARAALGRAEVRSLNAGQLGDPPTAKERARSHQIQNAIDMLDAGRTSSARRLIETLLDEPSQAPASE
ncbi:hypothetical protein HN018_23950 (plasmid) [Lichenicola cladoniae]|uniref:Uncharacterized protein n=1 Tax=Lichenicola cladoniae TaxID=1484109 RepID=A0A6M8HXV6_9PROT|nr:hypothetical protein [Lichenicola cladoniae]NPD69816.1 hypothetical protein [Acetobacteraceae bacterium]QKE93232.1 hypothetical protein HN018_23950 [Lichenicola cladoniae]